MQRLQKIILTIIALSLLSCHDSIKKERCLHKSTMRCYQNRVEICNSQNYWATVEDCTQIDADCIYNYTDSKLEGVAACEYVHEI